MNFFSTATSDSPFLVVVPSVRVAPRLDGARLAGFHFFNDYFQARSDVIGPNRALSVSKRCTRNPEPPVARVLALLVGAGHLDREFLLVQSLANGVGYRVQPQGADLKLNLGFSHDVIYKVPQGVSVGVEQNIITVSGISKQQVGQAAAEIRALKKPEPYKGKGIKYSDERVLRKSGKSGKE